MKFNEKLKSLRKEHGLTQVELADRLYVSRSLVARWEYGDIYPTIANLNKISDFFNVPLSDLLSEDEKTEIIVRQANFEKKIKNGLRITLNFVNFALSLLILSIFFPLLPIWGYVHPLITNSEPLLTVTITQQDLFRVLNDTFYNTRLKIIYVFIMILEIISLIISLFSLVVSFLRKKQKLSLCILMISCSINIILSLLIFSSFVAVMPLNIIGGFFLFLSVLLTILSFIFIAKQRKENL